jgi:hypothetical protein
MPEHRERFLTGRLDFEPALPGFIWRFITQITRFCCERNTRLRGTRGRQHTVVLQNAHSFFFLHNFHLGGFHFARTGRTVGTGTDLVCNDWEQCLDAGTSAAPCEALASFDNDAESRVLTS